MTDYPVQCFDNNGEPYGRYVTKLTTMHINCGCNTCKEILALSTFPFSSGIIGKTYERDEVEVVEQILTMVDMWLDVKHITTENRDKFKVIRPDRATIGDTHFRYRKIFRLVISKTETATQPVE